MAVVRDEVTVVPGTRYWPVSWSAIWVGALAALATALLFGLAGTALGAHELGHRVVKWRDFRLGALIFSVMGSFFAFVLGGWVAARIAGFQRSEPAMLHGAIAWLVALPLLLVFASLGATTYFGAWYGGLAGTPAWVLRPTGPVDPAAAMVARNSALGAITALLIGLVGSVVGGWLASGEPMTFTYYRRRPRRPA